MNSEMWQRIRVARKHASLTQKELGALCNVSSAAVTQWESPDPEKRTTPKNENLTCISNFTGAPIEWIMSNDSEIEAEWMNEIASDTTIEDIETFDKEGAINKTYSVAESPSRYGNSPDKDLIRRSIVNNNEFINLTVEFIADHAVHEYMQSNNETRHKIESFLMSLFQDEYMKAAQPDTILNLMNQALPEIDNPPGNIQSMYF